MKKVIETMVTIPNLPLFFLVLIYLVFKIVVTTGIGEMNLIDIDEDKEVDKKLEKILDAYYPDWFANSIAIAFYTWLTIKITL